MAKLTITDYTDLSDETSFISKLNSDFTAIEAAIENTLSRDGTSPNTMSDNLDMNSNGIVNASSIQATTIVVNGVSVTTADLSPGDDTPALSGVSDANKLIKAANDGASYELTTTVPDDAVPTAGIQDGAVTTVKIGADAVDGTKIADDSIDSEHYVDGSIDTAHIADNAVNLAKLDDTTVYASQAEAEAGTDTTKIMTAQRVAQAITAQVAVGDVFTEGSITAGSATYDGLSTLLDDNSSNDEFLEIQIECEMAGSATWIGLRYFDGGAAQSGASDYYYSYRDLDTGGEAGTQSTAASEIRMATLNGGTTERVHLTLRFNNMNGTYVPTFWNGHVYGGATVANNKYVYGQGGNTSGIAGPLNGFQLVTDGTFNADMRIVATSRTYADL